MWWLILQSLIIGGVCIANVYWKFTNTMTATVIGVFIAAVVTGMITHHVLGMPKER